MSAPVAASVPASLRARLDEVLAARDRDFPRRDPDNTRAMTAALGEYVRALAVVRDPDWRPDATRIAAASAMRDRPVVVCGFMKSGTTLLIELLDGHPELCVLPGDSHMVNGREDALRRTGGAAHWMRTLVNPRGQAPFWLLGADDAPYLEFMGYLDEALRTTSDDARGRFLAFVTALHCANPRRAPAPRAWVEKTPENERHVTTILDWFPEARFIHIVRDPLENLASVKELFRQREWGWKRWSAAATARKLARSIATADAHRRKLGADRYHVVRYEDLEADAPNTMRDVVRFLGVPWDDALSTPTINGVPSQPNSMFGDRRGVQGRVAARRTERWRVELGRTERVAASAMLARARRRWGYR